MRNRIAGLKFGVVIEMGLKWFQVFRGGPTSV